MIVYKLLKIFKVERGVTGARWVKIFCVLFLVGDILVQPWLASPRFGVDEIGFYRDLGSKIHLVGEVVGEPDLRSDMQNLTVEVREVLVAGRVAVHGKIMVKAQRYPEYLYGQILDITCRLQTPPVFEKFSYAALLAKDDIFALCLQPRIWVAAGSSGESEGLITLLRRGFWGGIFALKSWMIARVNELYAEPAASLVAGILIGARRAILQGILDDFKDRKSTRLNSSH